MFNEREGILPPTEEERREIIDAAYEPNRLYERVLRLCQRALTKAKKQAKPKPEFQAARYDREARRVVMADMKSDNNNRAQRRNLGYGRRRHRPDGTVGTQPPIYKRVARRRAAAKRARTSRKTNR